MAQPCPATSSFENYFGPDGQSFESRASSLHSGNPRARTWVRYGGAETVRALALPMRARKIHGNHHKGDAHLHEHWIEILNDLILVAFLSNLGHVLIGAGPTIQNFLMIFLVFLAVLQSALFVSIAANIWLVEDFFTLAMLLLCTAGTFLMSDAVQIRAHYPCYDSLFWGAKAGFTRLKLFYSGALLSTLGQVFIFLRSGKGISVLFEVVRPLIFVIGLLAAFIQKYKRYLDASVLLLTFNFLTFLMCFWGLRDPHQVALLNASHLFSRLGVLVVTALGEWIIQIVCHWMPDGQSTEISFVAVQLLLCFCIALQYNNTRPHEIPDTILSTKPGRTFGIIIVHFVMAFGLFVVGASIDLEINVMTMEDDSEGHGHAALRRLGQGHGAKHCTDGTVEWPHMGIKLQSVALACVQVLLLIIRQFWKLTLQMEQGVNWQTPGKKYFTRLALGLCHALVPLVIYSDTEFVTALGLHLVLFFPHLIMDSWVRTRRLRSDVLEPVQEMAFTVQHSISQRVMTAQNSFQSVQERIRAQVEAMQNIAENKSSRSASLEMGSTNQSVTAPTSPTNKLRTTSAVTINTNRSRATSFELESVREDPGEDSWSVDVEDLRNGKEPRDKDEIKRTRDDEQEIKLNQERKKTRNKQPRNIEG